MSDQILASAIETLIGGTADTFVVCAGAGLPVGRKTVAEVKALLSLIGTNSGDQDLSSYATTAAVAAGYVPKTETRYQAIALSGSGSAIAAGGKKGVWPIKENIRIVSVSIDCDPANEPSSVAVEVDANRIDRSTGVATSILSAVASISTSANTGTGTVSGTQDFDAGSMMTFDVDQGSDGKELLVSVGYTIRY